MLRVIKKRPLYLQFTSVIASDHECKGLIATEELIIIFGDQLEQHWFLLHYLPVK